ncbi:MAG TPA: VWA domain-containing protein, partial [Pyrinomonadaceae bacterium]
MRSHPSLFAILLAVGLLAPAFAQRPANNPQRPAPKQQQSPQPEEDEEVVRITTNLVQVDAVVTDEDGRHVTDLTPADFEVLEDGRRQEITNFSYVNVEPEAGVGARPVSTPVARAERDALPVPPARLKPGRARRTVALVVDDLSMSAQTTVEIRRALKKYIDEQIDGDDLSAIIRTSSGSGVLQQFTADKRLLGAAVERLRWLPRGRGGIGAVRATASELEVTGGDFDEFSTAGTLGALASIIRGFQSLPGRKAVVLFTDSLPIKPDGINLERYRRLVDLANRSSVTFYTVDSRGLQPLDATASDPGNMPHQSSVAGLRQSFLAGQDGMHFLAKGTGGLFFRNQNNINKGLQEVLDDQRGYYLLAYRPADSTFDPRTGERKFRDLKVGVKRAGLSVRSRNGFFGVPGAADKERRPADTRRQLLDALSSPFGAADIDLRMAALFVTDPARAPAIRSIIHLNANDLQFAEIAGGRRKAVLDVAAVVFTGDGRPAVQGRDQREVILGEDEYRDALKNGLNYRLNVPVRLPGTYNLRVAVRDASSGRLGSAREFVHVPDLGKGPLALSGVVLSGVEP